MYRFERILCPTDFSHASDAALRYAAFLAEHYRGRITLLHVDEREKTAMGDFGDNEAAREEHRGAVQTFAAARFARLIDETRLHRDTTTLLIRFGTAYKEIIFEAEAENYSAVVLSTQGMGCSSPHLVGRTADRVVRLCRAPVMTVSLREHEAPWKIESILCPTDFSEYGNYALPYAISIARHYKAKLILAHATDISTAQPELLLSKFPDLSLYHDGASQISVDRLVSRDIEPGNFIVRLAEEHEVDMIVMGTHGARGLRRVQIGNTTEEVIRRVFMPVLSITHPIHKTVFPRRFAEEYAKENI